MRPRRLRIFSLAALLLLVAPAFIAGPAAGAFSPANLSNNAGSSMNPTLAINGTTLIAMWQDSTPGNSEIFMRRSLDTGVTWSALINVSNTPGNSGTPPSAGAPREYDWAFVGRYLYVVWTEEVAGGHDIFLRRSLDGGATFQPAVDLATDIGSFGSPRVAVSGRNVYVAWHISSGSSFGVRGIYFRRSGDAGASFAGAINLDSIDNLNGLNDGLYPSIIALGPHVFVLWAGLVNLLGKPFQIFLRASSDRGASFGPIVPLSTSCYTCDEVSATPNMQVPSPNVYVVWSEYSGGVYKTMLRISKDSGASFGSMIEVSAGTTSFSHTDPQIIVAGSFVLVIWYANYGKLGVNVFYRRSADGGSTWSAIQNLSYGIGVELGSISWTLAGADLHVAWASPTGAPDILYRRGTDVGSNFGGAVNLSNDAGNSRRPQILVAGQDVFAAWDDDTLGNSEIFFLRSTTGGF